MSAVATSSQRESILGPFLDLIQRTAATEGPTGTPAAIGEALGEWERAALREAAPWSAVVAEAAAFQVKYRTETEQLGSTAPSDKIREGWIAGAAVGSSLMEDLQLLVDGMVEFGDVDRARRLSGLRGRVGRVLGQLRDHLPVPDLEEAARRAADLRDSRLRLLSGVGAAADEPSISALAESMRRHAKESAPKPAQGPERLCAAEESASEPEQGPERHVPRARPRGEHGVGRTAVAQVPQTASGPSTVLRASPPFAWPRLPIKTLSGVGLVVLLLAVVLGLTLSRAPEPEPLVREDFSAIPELIKVMSRPPNVYLTVDSTTWHGLSRTERLALVERVARVAESNGYTGAHFSSNRNQLLGQWRPDTGSRLF